MKNEKSWRIEQGKGYWEEGSKQSIVMWWEMPCVEHWDANINTETNISNSGYCFSNTPSRQQSDSSMNDDFLLLYFSLWKEGDKKECFFCQHEYCFYRAPMLIRNNSSLGTSYPPQIDQCGNVACLSKTIWSGYHNHQITFLVGKRSLEGVMMLAGGNIGVATYSWVLSPLN